MWRNPQIFPQDSRDNTNLPAKIVQSATRRPSKVFTVNVINSGDPLEIYTSKEGEVIFKKYSLMGGVDEFAAQIVKHSTKPPA